MISGFSLMTNEVSLINLFSAFLPDKFAKTSIPPAKEINSLINVSRKSKDHPILQYTFGFFFH